MMRLLKFIALCIIMTPSACQMSNPNSQTKDVTDIVSVTNVDQNFVVLCKDGNTESLSASDFQNKVAANSICEAGSSGQLYCEPYSSDSFKLKNLSSGIELGDTAMPLARCKSFLDTARSGIVCGAYSSSSARIYNTKTGQEFGDGTSSDDSVCLANVKAARYDVACGPYSDDNSRIYRISDNKEVSSTRVGHSTCQKLSMAATSELVCAPYSSTSAKLTNYKTLSAMGSSTDFDSCMASMP